MNWKNSTLAAALTFGLLGAVAYAQPYTGPTHGYGGYGMGPGMMGGYGGWGPGPGMMGGYGGWGHGPGMMGGIGLWAIHRLDLSDAQRTQLGRIEDDLRKKNWELMGQMQDELSKLRSAWSADKADRGAILAANKRVSDLRQRMLENRLDAQDNAEALLTPQQKEQYRKLVTSADDDD